MYYSYLSTHVKSVHEGLKEYKCDICGKCFGQQSNLSLHLKGVHKQEYVTCPICGKSFANFYLSRHVKVVHEGLKEYKCNISWLCTVNVERRIVGERKSTSLLMLRHNHGYLLFFMLYE